MNCIASVIWLQLLAVVTLFAPNFAVAQGYPVKPIRVVIGTAPDLGPRLIGQKINSDIAQVLKMPDINERLVAAGFEPAQTTVEQFDEFVKKDFRRYEKVIKESHIRID